MTLDDCEVYTERDIRKAKQEGYEQGKKDILQHAEYFDLISKKKLNMGFVKGRIRAGLESTMFICIHSKYLIPQLKELMKE